VTLPEQAKSLWHSLADTQQLARAIVPLADTTARDVIRSFTAHDLCYWAYRDRDIRIAGFGVAACPDLSLTATQELLASAKLIGEAPAEARRARAYLGASFAAGDEGIGALGRRRLVVPAIEIIDLGENSYLAVNRMPDATFPELRSSQNSPFAIDSGHSVPDQAGWCEAVSHALHELRIGTLTKVVLSRKVVFDLQKSLPIGRLFAHFADRTPAAFHCLHKSGEDVFFALTPERLFRMRDRHVESEAVAGTRLRGHNDPHDTKLGEELLESDKDRREHRNVVEHVVRTLRALGGDVTAEEQPSLRKLPRVQHLYQRIDCQLPAGVTTDSVLSTLHPTPAVCGEPPATSLSLLQRLEPFSRGWYAGPVGVISADEVDLAVGIRAGAVEAGTLSLFAGAGIVDGSEPLAEWHETEAKLAWMLELLQEPW